MDPSTDLEEISKMAADADNVAATQHTQETQVAYPATLDGVDARCGGGSPPSAAEKALGITELTEKILASDIGMQQLFALKRVNKHFHNCITGHLLSSVMFPVRARPSLGPFWDGPYDFAYIKMNPFLHAILGRYCLFDVEEEEPDLAAPTPMDLHLDIDREDLPSLVKRLDDALSGTKLWHATLVAEMSPFREVQIRCYSTCLPDPALHRADHQTLTSSSNTEVTDTMASLSNPAAVGKVFSIVELTERILASGINMVDLFKLKRVNKHFRDIITSSTILKPAMFLSYKTGGRMFAQRMLGNDAELTLNPTLISTLSALGRCEIRRGFTCRIEIKQTFDGFPGLISALDQCLQANAQWLGTLVTSAETVLHVQLEREKKPNIRWTSFVHRDFPIYGGETVGDLMRELRAHAGKIQEVPADTLVVMHMDLFASDHTKRLTNVDMVRRLASRPKQRLMAALYAEEVITESEAQG
ncbi:hypothetical protein B0A48_04515 [Cryoendolithus antarcticus]|uniref:F-box domain-containing protein n=1 Tax=Cryoendolithus antarcticus TaxID=1507870 RepID=A0A1V8TFX6_9PEZI|nr:hypothetical protein B0A48_04515 [Cryoendolithus antarcticus]